MSLIFKSEDRRVIPRLRSFKLSASTGELSLHISKETNILKSNDDLTPQLTSWKRSPTVVSAGNLLSSAFVLGLESHYIDIAEYILNRSKNPNVPIVRLSKKILGLQDSPEQSPSSMQDYRIEIQQLKQSLGKEPKNPIAWMEIGRLYSLEGQVKKASNCIERALYLDKNNRFIARSASRFFHHFSDDKERSIYIIKKSEYAKYDPWLISAEIAYSSILRRHSTMAKLGQSFISSGKYNNESITELASALGTLEFSYGNIKEARKYLKQSLLAPNDNSLAQITWMSEKMNGLLIEENKYNVPLAFEAKTKHFYHSQEFKTAFEESLRWHSDEPFSTRPIKMASLLSSVFLKDHKKSIELTKKALTLTKSDPILTNNLIYFMVQDNQVDAATLIFERDLQSLATQDTKSNDQIPFVATAGLIAYRGNNPIEGKFLYLKAIQLAKSHKNFDYAALATANYVKEALRFTKTHQEQIELMNLLRATCEGNKEPDIIQNYNDVKLEFDQMNENRV